MQQLTTDTNECIHNNTNTNKKLYINYFLEKLAPNINQTLKNMPCIKKEIYKMVKQDDRKFGHINQENMNYEKKYKIP